MARNDVSDSDEDVKPLRPPPTLDLERFRFTSSPRRSTSIAADRAIASYRDATPRGRAIKREPTSSPIVKREPTAPTVKRESPWPVIKRDRSPSLAQDRRGSRRSLEAEEISPLKRAKQAAVRPMQSPPSRKALFEVYIPSSYAAKTTSPSTPIKSPVKPRSPSRSSEDDDFAAWLGDDDEEDEIEDEEEDSDEEDSDEDYVDAAPAVPATPSKRVVRKSQASTPTKQSVKRRTRSNEYVDPSVLAHLPGLKDSLEAGLRVVL